MRILLTIVVAVTLSCDHPKRAPARPIQDAPREAPPVPAGYPTARDIERETEDDIHRLVTSLESKNAHVCLDAVDYLPTFGSLAIPALLDELKSVSPNGRALAAATLGRIPDKQAIPALIELLNDRGAIELNVLSDDGTELHPCYDSDLKEAVQKQAAYALEAITGHSLGVGDGRWKEWWQTHRESFDPLKVERPILFTHPPLEVRYPLPSHSKYLKGVFFCIDPGHGGDAQKRGYKRGPTYAREAEMNLRVARFLKDFLEQAGARVIMTRYGDRDVALEDRSRIANRNNVDLFISIHHNWSPRMEATGTTIWHHFTPDHSPASMDLARSVEEEVLKALDLPEMPRGGGLMSDRLMYETGFAVLRHLTPDVPGILCELTYYSNLQMERKLRSIDFNRQEAYGVFLGIAKYLYYGIPRAVLVEADLAGPRPQIQFHVRDGLEDRKDWALPHRIFAQHILVKIDGRVLSHVYDKGLITVTPAEDLAPGEHSAEVVLINVHKNHSWPKPHRFRIR